MSSERNILGQIDQFIAAADAAQDVDGIHSATSKQIQALGFEFFGYQLLSPPTGPQVRLYLTNKPKGWTLRYVEQNYISDDLVTRHAARTVRPFLWHEITPKRMMTPTQQLMFCEAGDFGLNAGGTIPIYGPAAAKALFSVSNTTTKEAFAQLFMQERHVLQIIGTYVHEHLLRLGLQTLPPAPKIKLSPRELQVLTWSARGKTAWEISSILSLSEATVREYSDNACQKLGTHSKIQAVATALLHSLIIP